MRSASAFSRTFTRLRFPDDPPPNPLAPPKLCVNYFINSCHLVTLCYFINFCHLLILCYARTLYMYLLCTPDNTTLIPVLSSARTLCAKILFQLSRRLWPSCHSDLGGSRHGWALVVELTDTLQMLLSKYMLTGPLIGAYRFIQIPPKHANILDRF